MIPDDLKELLRAFNDHGVKYLIVGGYAFGVHAEPRATKDLDIFIRRGSAEASSAGREHSCSTANGNLRGAPFVAMMQPANLRDFDQLA